MIAEVHRIDIPVCECVKAARKLSTIFPIRSKYRTEGSAAGTGVGSTYGYFVVYCDWCGSFLKHVEGHDFAKPAQLNES